MKYLVIDGSLHGTGIRDYYSGGYIEPENLDLSSDLTQAIKKWLDKYENEHYNSFKNTTVLDELDAEGIEIARMLKRQLSEETKVDYYSSARMKREVIF